MFKTITRLLFGGEEETTQDVKSGEVLEEGWLVVSHQEAVSAEDPGAELPDTQPALNSAMNGETLSDVKTDTSMSDPEPKVQSSSPSRAITSSVFQPKAFLQATQTKTKIWADRHHMTRNAIQRQNRVRQGVPHQSFPLHQPGHRTLSH